MSKKKKKKQFSNLPSSIPVITPLPPQPLTDLNFDGIEDRIRGEEKLMEQKVQKEKEVRAFEKDMKTAEIDKRLEELRKQLGLEKATKKKY
jgi:hypothetical protein